MRNSLYIGALIILLGCGHPEKADNATPQVSPAVTRSPENPQRTPTSAPEENRKRSYNDRLLETYLDSIGDLSPVRWMKNAAFTTDSVFRNRTPWDKTIRAKDFALLKNGCKTGMLDIALAKRIFGDIAGDSAYLEQGALPLQFIPFDTRESNFHEFAICPLGDGGWDCDVFFFSGNRIVAKHHIYHRYGLQVDHYKDRDGKTVIYYKENYRSGSGIWWFNYCFYKYDGGKLIPVLNELAEANQQFPWGARIFTLKSTVQKTNPLTLKMVYSQAFSDGPESPVFIHDSTLVRYTWHEESKTFRGVYEKSKITKPQILTYYLEDTEHLFIHTHHDMLKRFLQTDTMRTRTLDYLDLIKIHSDE
ncbi:hypothetical protein [Parachryseolinea silvisoli]|uniref:hypothetical protein n=1 Tax=Parachryseolinea silvisoli TaxID=2873601 RepID=UPI002265B6A1|nr:hypothetical protein [Parachryseolinea silvisoli]MCD9014457.1 hypothetical protein [Parachryseolinea silvisoli]